MGNGDDRNFGTIECLKIAGNQGIAACNGGSWVPPRLVSSTAAVIMLRHIEIEIMRMPLSERPAQQDLQAER